MCDQWTPQVEAKVAKLSEVLELLLPGASEAICGVAWLIWAAAGYLSDSSSLSLSLSLSASVSLSLCVEESFILFLQHIPSGNST